MSRCHVFRAIQPKQQRSTDVEWHLDVTLGVIFEHSLHFSNVGMSEIMHQTNAANQLATCSWHGQVVDLEHGKFATKLDALDLVLVLGRADVIRGPWFGNVPEKSQKKKGKKEEGKKNKNQEKQACQQTSI